MLSPFHMAGGGVLAAVPRCFLSLCANDDDDEDDWDSLQETIGRALKHLEPGASCAATALDEMEFDVGSNLRCRWRWRFFPFERIVLFWRTMGVSGLRDDCVLMGLQLGASCGGVGFPFFLFFFVIFCHF